MHEAAKLVRQDKLLHLLVTGYSLKECATQIDISYNTARAYAREPQFLESLKALSADIHSRVVEELKMNANTMTTKLEEASSIALDVLKGLMEDEKMRPDIRFKAASDIMDRNAETAKNKKIETSSMHGNISADDLIHAARTASELETYNELKEEKSAES